MSCVSDGSKASVEQSSRRVFHTLDALRGIAALLVMIRHSGWLLIGKLDFAESHLAVDLFFLMSGVVLAHSYEQRLLSGQSPWRFIALRYYLVFAKHDPSRASGSRELVGLVLALLMLPSFGFPFLLLPRWSLAFELFINAAYGFFIRRLTTPVLTACVGFAALGLVFVEFHEGTIDVGWMTNALYAGFFRVVFSFFAGVLIVRKFSVKSTHRPMAAWLCVAAVTALLTVTFPIPRPLFELAVVIIAFPVIVTLAMRFEVSRMTQRIFSFLGVTSYAVYVLHDPLIPMFYAMAAHFGRFSGATITRYSGVPFILTVVLVSWILDRLYDQPVRAYLQALLRTQPSRTSGARVFLQSRLRTALRPLRARD